MEKLLARLERRFGGFAIPNLTWIIVGGMVVSFILSFGKPQFLDLLTLDVVQVRHGQVWRLVTYLFLPPSLSPIWVIFAIYWFWMIGTNLESEWGPFKFNLFYLLGMLGTTVAAVLTGGESTNGALNGTLFLAFATLFPDFQIMLFFILPIRVKWLGMLAAAGLILSAVLGDWTTRGAVVAGSVNYVFFFAGHWVQWFRQRNLRVRQAARRAEQVPYASALSGTGARECAICGAKETDGADIRLCSCEKCGGKPRNLCVAHARNH
ncbi:hypothetical protein BH09MYX1_BH09MYX1_46400 [soil metagenome]